MSRRWRGGYVRRLTGALLCLAGLPCVSQAAASGWQWQVSPWMWGAGMRGDVQAFRELPSTPVSQSFQDVLNHMQFSGFLDVSGQRGRLLVLSDVMMINTRIRAASHGARVALDTRLMTGTLGTGWRVVDTPATSVDLTAGVQYWHTADRLSLSGPLVDGSRQENSDWWLPVAGGHLWVRPAPDWSAGLLARAGASGSARTRQLTGVVSWQWTPSLALSGGWHWLRAHHQAGGLAMDTLFQGPLLALTWQF